MDNDQYEDESTNNEEENASSIEGKGWEILAGGQENSFAMGGDDPFDLKSTGNPDPYSDDDEADWILTSGSTPESARVSLEEETATPRDLTPEELIAMGGGGPITAPPNMFPGGSQMPIDAPSNTSPGLSAGVSITPVGEGEESPITSPSDTPYEPYPFVAAAPTTIAPQSGPYEIDSSTMPSVVGEDPSFHSSTPSPSDATGTMPMPGGEIPADTPLGGSKDAPPEPSGSPVFPPAAPLIPPASIPPVPDVPPWPIPQPQGLSQGGFFVADPFLRTPISSSAPLLAPTEELEPTDDLRQMLITPDRINALWDEIDETFNLVISDVRGHYETTERAIADLKRAREYILAGAQYYDNAEQLVIGVKARLRLEEKVRQWSRSRGAWIAVYLVIWLLVLSAGSLLTGRVVAVTDAFIPAFRWLSETYLPALFGGLGGVAGALWILVKHTTVKRDFDPIHTPWYITNPVMGCAMGVVTYFVVRVGGNTLFNIAGSTDSMDFTTGSLAVFLFLLCIVIGFNQNVLWSLIDRVIDTIFPRPPEDKTAASDITSVERPVIVEPMDPKGPQG
jgi:hypothetical protein